MGSMRKSGRSGYAAFVLMLGCASSSPLTSYSSGSQTSLLLYADNHERTFLGCLNCSEYDSASVWNQYSEYGNSFGDTSIRNPHSDYGSRHSDLSACNPYASSPPRILDGNDNYYGRFTLNKSAGDANNEDYIKRLVALVCAR